jgi:hypothetical protein
MSNDLLSLIQTKFSNHNIQNILNETKYIYNGTPVPRVTEIIGKMISEEYLLQWANNLGFYNKSYELVRDKAATIGENAHKSIEEFLTSETPNSNSNFIPFLSFKQWWDDINNAYGKYPKVLLCEEELVSQFFGGTCDLVMQVSNMNVLVDFKTSNHISYKYFLQLAAYRYMLKLLKGIDINLCIILQLDKRQVLYTEYVIDLAIPEMSEFMDWCLYTFMTLVNGYYSILYSEQLYNQIFKEK